MKKSLWLLPVLAILASCQDNEEYQLGGAEKGLFEVSIDDASRTVINGLKTSFVEGDKIGITSGGYLNVEGEIKKPATGTTLYADPVQEVTFAAGDSIYAYYPYSTDCDGKTLTFTLPATQVQSDAGATHMTQYDLLVAQPKVLKETKNSMTFYHTMAWMDFTVYNESKDAATIESVTIKARNKVFPTKATLNLCAKASDADYKVLQPVELTDEITISTSGEGWNVAEYNGSVTLRMAVMPVDLSNEVLTITAKTSKQTYEVKGSGMKLQAGRCYQYECGEAYYELEQLGDKEFYIAYEYREGGAKENDFHSNNSVYSYKRCKQTENFILFWDKSWGDKPTAFDVDAILGYAENIYDSYVNKLGFKGEGKSYLDQYKCQIFILEGHASDALATGSGYDDKIGALWAWIEGCTAETMAHEIGHSFQYQTYCDARLDPDAPSKTCGWRYGFGPNGRGGCAWWEQCAQWQCYKVYPRGMFSGWYGSFPPNTMKHPLHEEPRYANYFIQNFWVDLHGEDFIGKLWRYSKQYEDPFDTYMRITEVSLDEFNNEMFEYACRLQTYDMAHTRANGGDRYWDAFSQYTQLNTTEDGYYQVGSGSAPENYGFNAIRLRVPAEETVMSVELVGLAGADGYRKPISGSVWNVDAAGWKFGFVAVDKDGNRIYGDAGTATGANGTGTVSFTCPAGAQYLWLVVMGAPTEYWHHEWDDNDANDEQWPYKIKLTNATLRNTPPKIVETWDEATLTYTYDVEYVKPSTQWSGPTVTPDYSYAAEALGLTTNTISNATFNPINADGSLYTGNKTVSESYGAYFNEDGNVEGYPNPIYLATNNFATGIVAGCYTGMVELNREYNVGFALSNGGKTVYFKFNITVLD